jgi:acyl carrier protein
MSSPTVFQRLQVVIVETLGVDVTEVVPNASYVNDLGADSLDLVELQQNTEQAFQVEIPDADAEQQKKVQDTVNYLNKVLA